MAIPHDTIEKIRLSVDITDVVRDYVPNLKKAGRNWKANCPFHNERTPSFMVSPEKGIFHCFGCHVGGDVFKFTMLADNISWIEAVKKLAIRSGIEIKESKEETVKRSDKQKIYDLLEQAASFYNRCLKEHSSSSLAKEYLNKRGMTQASIEKFQIGYAPEGLLLQMATKKGYSNEDLIKAGLMTKTERGRLFEYMSNRIVFPIFDTQGRVVAFGGRTLKDDNPKYLNTPETLVYSKSYQLYGLHQAVPTIRKNKRIIVLEGYMDVVVTHQEGVTDTIGTLGTALTSHHASILKRYAEDIFLLFDSDSAGKNAAIRAIDMLIETALPVRILNLPEKKDPDEYILEKGLDGFDDFIKSESRTIIEFLVGHLINVVGISTPEKKVKIVSEIMPYINKVKNAILRREWIKYLAEKISISENDIYEEWKKISRKNLRKGKTEPAKKGNVKIRSAEEEIIKILLMCPEYIKDFDEYLIKDYRNKNVFNFLKNKTEISEIITELDEQDASWLTELALEEKEYSNVKEVLNSLIREIRNKELEIERLQLEKEIEQMISGKVPLDNEKVQLYHQLSKQLKGSVKD